MAVNKIQKFIKANKLSFDGEGSNLNGNCVILAGYACYLDLTCEELIKQFGDAERVVIDELERVFEYAQYNDYGDWWETLEAKETYKF